MSGSVDARFGQRRPGSATSAVPPPELLCSRARAQPRCDSHVGAVAVVGGCYGDDGGSTSYSPARYPGRYASSRCMRERVDFCERVCANVKLAVLERLERLCWEARESWGGKHSKLAHLADGRGCVGNLESLGSLLGELAKFAAKPAELACPCFFLPTWRTLRSLRGSRACALACAIRLSSALALY